MQTLHGIRIGQLAGVDQTDGRLLISFAGAPETSEPAESLLHLDSVQLRRALAENARVAVAFSVHPGECPLILGLLAPAMRHDPEPPQKEEGIVSVTLPLSTNAEARVDGKTVLIEGTEQVILRCGEVCIELRRDGKLILKGLHIVSDAEGVNRLRGGSVQIN